MHTLRHSLHDSTSEEDMALEERPLISTVCNPEIHPPARQGIEELNGSIKETTNDSEEYGASSNTTGTSVPSSLHRPPSPHGGYQAASTLPNSPSAPTVLSTKYGTSVNNRSSILGDNLHFGEKV